jgi:Contractile injection system tube protein
VPDSTDLAKAELRELDAKLTKEIHPDTWVEVQFNPETLKVSFANQLVQPPGAGDQRGTPARQFVGAGTTKLSLQLWFDVTAPLPTKLPARLRGVDDVRRLTERVAYFITPQPNPKNRKQLIPPAVRFLWGSFQFDGMMDSLEESLEFFSHDGRPLRASLSLALSQQKITKYSFADSDRDDEDDDRAPGRGGGGPRRRPGTRPLTRAPANRPFQQLMAQAGERSWQAAAAANRIENPRLLRPGQLVDLGRGAASGGGRR